MKLPRFLTIFTIYRIAVGCNASTHAKFRKQSQYEGYLPTSGFLDRYTSKSAIDCASKCTTDDKCVTFVFVETSSLCQMHDHAVYGSDDMEATPTAVNYILVCSDYLISGPDGVPDDSLSASSSAGAPNLFTPNWARLNTTETAVGNGAWSAGTLDINQWIQVRFNIPKTVKAIAIQGRGYRTTSEYVREFTVKYSADCINFQDISDVDGAAMKFIGNSDWNTIETRMLPTLVTARCVRLYPTQWQNYISLRWDIVGC